MSEAAPITVFIILNSSKTLYESEEKAKAEAKILADANKWTVADWLFVWGREDDE